MSAAPGSGPALEKLQAALGESRELMNREYYAMRLVGDAKGYTDLRDEVAAVQLSADDAALSPDDKMKRAMEMVLDDEYYEMKDRIRTDMRESLNMLETLTLSTDNAAVADVRQVVDFVRMVIVLQILVIVFMVWLTVRLGINPVLKAVERIREDRPIREEGASEFRYLASTYNNLKVRLNEENELLKEVSRTDGLTTQDAVAGPSEDRATGGPGHARGGRVGRVEMPAEASWARQGRPRKTSRCPYPRQAPEASSQ
jgi:hypothetical protein